MVVGDFEGNEYGAHPTTLFDSQKDYMVVVVDTEKDNKSHPLWFSLVEPSLGDPVTFYTYPREEIDWGSKCLEHGDGNIVSPEDVFEGVSVVYSYPDILRGLLDRSVNKGFCFISDTICHGDSGAPVFSGGRFVGLVQGTYSGMVEEVEQEGVVENFGNVAGAESIFEGIGNYVGDGLLVGR